MSICRTLFHLLTYEDFYMNFDEYSGRRSPIALAAGQLVLTVVVEHLNFKRILDSCLDVVHTMLSLKLPSGVLIQADSGMGKTLLLQTVKRRLSTPNADGTPSVCLDVRLDSTVDIPKMAGAVMLALGYPMLPSRPNLENMNHLVAKGLARVKPKALMIDEMQHVCEGNKDITARAVTDWLKVRMDEFNLPVICAGTRALERLSVINPQFTGRASTNFLVPPFVYDESWRQLVGAFVVHVSAVDMAILNGPAAKLVHTGCEGNLRQLKRLLVYAVMHAAEQPGKKLGLEDLAKGYDDANGHSPGRANPFWDAANKAR